MMPDIHSVALLITWLAVLGVLMRGREWFWLLSAALCWLTVSLWLMAQIPEVLQQHSGLTYRFPQLYLLPGGLYFLCRRYRCRENGYFCFEGHPGVVMLAVTLLLVFAAWAAFGLLLACHYPGGATPYFGAAWLTLPLSPAYWLTAQALLGLVFYLHRRRVVRPKQDVRQLSLIQLEAGFLLALLFQTAWIIEGHSMVLIIRRLLYKFL